MLRKLASVRLAVLIIIALAALTAWGTFVEAKYGEAAAAQKIVYHSVYMYAVMIALCINLTAVMVDRWPWKRNHLSFVCAHIGIMVLLLGSVVTHYFGVDGSMTFGIGQTARKVMVTETDLVVYAALADGQPVKLWEQNVDFFRNPPSKKPLRVRLQAGDGELEVLDYYPYALRDEKIVESDRDEDGGALRFQLQNANVNVTDWIAQPGRFREVIRDLGPAKIVLSPMPYQAGEENAIILQPRVDGKLAYRIHSRKENRDVKNGIVASGDVIQTPWMGLEMRLLKYLPQSRTQVSFKPLEAATPLTTSALKVRFRGEEQWFGLNSFVKLFTMDKVYIVLYSNRLLDIGFDLSLEKFNVGRYPGSTRAASYESVVQVPGIGRTVISMNEPLKYNGFTFYQASFQEDERGQPTHSVLSVNRDPGRWLKYLGSAFIVAGIIHLFFFRKRRQGGLL